MSSRSSFAQQAIETRTTLSGRFSLHRGHIALASEAAHRRLKRTAAVPFGRSAIASPSRINVLRRRARCTTRHDLGHSAGYVVEPCAVQARTSAAGLVHLNARAVDLPLQRRDARARRSASAIDREPAVSASIGQHRLKHSQRRIACRRLRRLRSERRSCGRRRRHHAAISTARRSCARQARRDALR